MRTTVIGAYPKPDWVPIEDWFGKTRGTDTSRPTAGYCETIREHAAHIEELLDRATCEVVAEQDALGIDIPTDGEVRRENYIHYHCRHIKGFDFDRLTTRTMRGHYQAHLPTITAAVTAGEPFLVRDWKVAQSATRKPVKITIPGPLTIGDSTADAFYGDARERGAALADVLNVEITRLAEAGCRQIQVDEPLFARKTDDALDFGIEHLERCFHGLPEEVTRTVHICCGYPDRLDPSEDYPKAPMSSYPRLASALDEAEIDVVSLEDAHRHNDLRLLESFRHTSVILGVVAIARSRVEDVEEIRARVHSALEHIDGKRLLLGPDCGLGFLGPELTKEKLANMVTAARSFEQML